MKKTLVPFFTEQGILVSNKDGIMVASVENPQKGLFLARDVLYKMVDPKTALFLSGGRTPKELYEIVGNEKKLTAGAVALIDERYGEKFHDNSNEKMIQDSGLLAYLESRNIQFYPILQDSMCREDSALQYDETVRYMFSHFPKTAAILGVGLDGHTAGIAGNRNDFSNPIFNPEQKNRMVSDFNDSTGMFKERITMTFLSLSQLDFMMVLVFGDDKKNALEDMFIPGDREEIPSRFFRESEIAKKTLLITDQTV